MDPVEEVYRSQHDRLWKSLLAFTGDPDLAAEAEAETFSQAFARGDELRNPEGWVWRTAFKVAAGIMAERRSRSNETDLVDAVDLESISTESAEIDSSLADFLDLLGSLSEQQRTVVILRYAGGFKPTEIAALLETTPGTVRVQLHRAHEHLRERIEQP
ncbi:MAG: RNA polymerase sigma factor [Acidimicrobiales bacterium]